jgi:hypothetical protein
MMTINVIFACEPVAELVLLYSWPLSSLFGIIIVKCLWFSDIARQQGFSSEGKSFNAMFLANIVTTIIAALFSMTFLSPPLIGIFFPIFVVLCCPIARRLNKISSWKLNPVFTVFLMILLFFGSIIFCALAGNIHGGGFATPTGLKGIHYQLAELAFIYCGLAVSFFLTALWEEYICGSILKSSFLPEVLRMNLYIMLFVWLMAAILQMGAHW